MSSEDTSQCLPLSLSSFLLCPLLTDSVVEQLRVSADIETVFDYVMKDPVLIAKTGTLVMQDVVSIRQILISLYGAFPIIAASMWEELRTNNAFLSTGSPCIDTLLNGGLLTGELTELSGPSSIGKTQLCLSFSVNTVINTKSTVIYIDTNGTFSISRINQIISREKYSQHLNDYTSVLEKFVVFNICDLFQMMKLIQDLETKLKTSDFYNRLHLLIIDSLDYLTYPLLGDHFLPLLSNLVESLRKLARDYSIVVLYTTGIFNVQGLKPVLIKTLVSIPHTKLVIESDISCGGEGKRILTLEKSQRVKSGATISL